MDLKETYNKIAEDWVKDHNKDDWWIEGTDTFLSLLSNRESVLDVGCGGGIKTKYISDKGYKVTGIDFSEKMIEIAKRELPGLDFDVVDVYDVDKYPKTFDGIFAQAVLLHVQKERIMEVLEKLKSRLNKGGILYIAVKGIKEDGIGEKVIQENDYGYDYERFFSFYSLDELKDYFKKLDMEVIFEKGFKVGWLQIIARKV